MKGPVNAGVADIWEVAENYRGAAIHNDVIQDVKKIWRRVV